MKSLTSSTACILLVATAIASMTAPIGDTAARGYSRQASNDLVQTVRDTSARFRDINVAFDEGYVMFLGCVSSPAMGAMGQHLVNFALVTDGKLDATRPEVLVYEPRANGELRLTAVDYLVFYDSWHANHDAPPIVQGQTLFLVNSPNRYGLPAFYTMHVWAFKHNRNGAFAMWNPNVKCVANYSVGAEDDDDRLDDKDAPCPRKLARCPVHMH